MPDKKSPNPSLTKAYIAAIDDEGVPYADASGKQDTNTNVVPSGSGGGSWVTDWFEEFTNRPDYADDSWLPEDGEIFIIPRELIDYIGIPDTHTIKPGPDFTPPGEPKVPSVIIAPRPKEPKKPRPITGKPRPIPDRIDRPRPRYPRPGILPSESLPPTM